MTSLYAYYTDDPDVIGIDLDADYYATPERMLEAIAYSDVDIIAVLNGGYPVNWGNDYAVIEFAAVGHRTDRVYVYVITPDDAAAVEDNGTVELRPVRVFERFTDVQVIADDDGGVTVEFFDECEQMTFSYTDIVVFQITPNVTHIYYMRSLSNYRYLGAITADDENSYLCQLADLLTREY